MGLLFPMRLWQCSVPATIECMLYLDHKVNVTPLAQYQPGRGDDLYDGDSEEEQTGVELLF